MGHGLSIEPTTNTRHYKWWVALAIAIILLGLSAWGAYMWYTTGWQPPISIPAAKADPRVDESDVSQTMIDSHEVPKDNPRYISIASIGIDKTRVYPVGVTPQNLLDTPKNINDAAWYKKSVTPGTGYGAVLIDGHNGGISKNGVFAKLHALEVGDEITVERGDRQTYTYKVVENQTMSLEEVNNTGMKMMMQSAESEKEGLNIITCAGKWIPRIQQFDQRVMLRAVAVDDKQDQSEGSAG